MNQSFFTSQLRTATVALIAYLSGRGVFTPADAGLATALVGAIGPILAPWLWSIYSNWDTKLVPHDSVAVQIPGAGPQAKPLIGTDASGITGKVVGALALGLLLLGADHAQAQGIKDIAKRNDANATASATPTVGRLGGVDLSDQLIAKVLPDLRYAAALAKQNNNQITSPCLEAVLSLVEGWQAPVKDASGNPLALPDPHVITDLERQAELFNQIQPDSKVSLGCAAMAQAVQKNVLSLLSGILSGGALGLFKLPIIP